MWAARMLAVSAVVCLSLSCDKDTPVVVPEEPSYVPPLEEKILLAASATQFISGYTEKNKKVTFLFSEPFHFESLPEDIEKVTLDWKDLLSLVDGQEGVRLTDVNDELFFLPGGARCLSQDELWQMFLKYDVINSDIPYLLLKNHPSSFGDGFLHGKEIKFSFLK